MPSLAVAVLDPISEKDEMIKSQTAFSHLDCYLIYNVLEKKLASIRVFSTSN